MKVAGLADLDPAHVGLVHVGVHLHVAQVLGDREQGRRLEARRDGLARRPTVRPTTVPSTGARGCRCVRDRPAPDAGPPRSARPGPPRSSASPPRPGDWASADAHRRDLRVLLGLRGCSPGPPRSRRRPAAVSSVGLARRGSRWRRSWFRPSVRLESTTVTWDLAVCGARPARAAARAFSRSARLLHHRLLVQHRGWAASTSASTWLYLGLVSLGSMRAMTWSFVTMELKSARSS